MSVLWMSESGRTMLLGWAGLGWSEAEEALGPLGSVGVGCRYGAVLG